jgi:glutathione synthase/RimK-type ligase-like ATP-grasp enzyme
MLYRIRLRTKNSSAEDLKTSLRNIKTTKPVVVRLGSVTPTKLVFPKSHSRCIEINSVDGINNSRDKYLMKQCFDKAKIHHCTWYRVGINDNLLLQPTGESRLLNAIEFPIVCKSRNGFQGKGNTYCKTIEEFNTWKQGKTLDNYIIEEFANYKQEFRIHASTNGIFNAWRKLRKSDAEEKWFFNSNNCVFTAEFQQPSCWEAINTDLIKALKELKLTLGGFDVRIKNDGSDFKVIEVNSACTLASQGTEAYRNEIVKLVNQKIQK